MSWLDAGFWRLLSKMKHNQSGIEWEWENRKSGRKVKGFQSYQARGTEGQSWGPKEWEWLAFTLLLATKSTILNNVTFTTDIQVKGTSETWVSNRNLLKTTETTQHFSFAKKTKTPLRNAYKRIAINVDYQKPPWTVYPAICLNRFLIAFLRRSRIKKARIAFCSLLQLNQH